MTWLVCDTPVSQPRWRLVCLPHAGGSPSFFRGWSEHLPRVEVHAACYPGRAERIEEAPPTDLRRLAADITEAVLPLADRPLALFGHSLGAVMALEVARELQRRGVRLCHLFASGSRVAPLPDRTADDFDDDPDAVIERLVRHGGTGAAMLADPLFRDLILPYVIGDGRMFHDYVMDPGPTLNCPITTIVGDGDDEADRRPWAELTTGTVREVVVSGNHFYLSVDPPFELVAETLSAATAGSAVDDLLAKPWSEDMTQVADDPQVARARDGQYVWHPWSPLEIERDRLMIVRGEGWRVWDTGENEYIDASSVSSTCGYGHPDVVEAVARQLGRLHGIDLSAANHELAGVLAQRLASYLPDSLSRTLFVNSGSEGIEAAAMIAASYWSHIGEPRTRMVTFGRGYHGSTILARSLSALPPTAHYFQEPLRVTKVELPGPDGAMRDSASRPMLISAFERAIGVDPEDRPMAVLVEPLLNVGGGVVLPPGFLRALRDLCDETGTPLIVDEVFTGYGRTGRMFAFQHDGVEPDIVVSSKGLSGGYAPIAAVTVRQRIYQTFNRDPVIGGLRYGHTTSGHAVACVAAVATLDVIEKERLVEHSAKLGARLLERLAPLAGRGAVTDVRGLGLLVILEMSTERAAGELVASAQGQGVLVRQQGRAVMAVPPLTVSREGVDAIADRITAAVDASADRTEHVDGSST